MLPIKVKRLSAMTVATWPLANEAQRRQVRLEKLPECNSGWRSFSLFVPEGLFRFGVLVTYCINIKMFSFVKTLWFWSRQLGGNGKRQILKVQHLVSNLFHI